MDGELLRALGQALWGGSWKTDMADALKVARKSVDDWSRDRMPVPGGVWGELQVLGEQRRVALDGLLPRILLAKAAAETRPKGRSS